MGWEWRRSQQYYYQFARIDGKPRRIYIGSGAIGRLHASIDAEVREQRRSEQQQRQAWRNAQRLLRDGIELARAVVAASLTLEGWYSHKGQWRKARRRSRARLHQPLPVVPREPLRDVLRALALRTQRGDTRARHRLNWFMRQSDELQATVNLLLSDLDSALDRLGAENGLPVPPLEPYEVAGGLVAAMKLAADLLADLARQAAGPGRVTEYIRHARIAMAKSKAAQHLQEALMKRNTGSGPAAITASQRRPVRFDLLD